jgi:peptidoglycan/xylan/chitin deacetylase (PgdA/CDA1 family)
MLTISVPGTFKPEREWIIRTLLLEFLGIDYHLDVVEVPGIRIACNGSVLEMSDEFFGKKEDDWLKEDSLPACPLSLWDSDELGVEINLLNKYIPVIYGKPNCEVSNKKKIKIGIDIFGSAFFLLSRYEEAVLSDRDEHNRFPSNASIAFKEKFMDRPIVNEYLEILWSCLKYLWPGIRRKKRDFRMLVSADVDRPYRLGVKNILWQVVDMGQDLLQKKDPKRAVYSMVNSYKGRRGDLSYDPQYNNCKVMMDINESAGNKMSFFFISGDFNTRRDGCYTLDEPVIRKLIRSIHDRGHEIGLHPSYQTYLDEKQLRLELENLLRVLGEENIKQEVIGGRQHYLRWETPTTARNWESAGLNYDSTLGYADSGGFRCGTCYEYSLYDIHERRELRVRERPLVVMEVGIVPKPFKNNAFSRNVIDRMQHFKEVCRKYNGDFVFLWHNTTFYTEQSYSCYKELVES